MQNELLTFDSNDGIALRTNKHGRLAALHWAHHEVGALNGDDLQVEAYATGLNFRVSYVALGGFTKLRLIYRMFCVPRVSLKFPRMDSVLKPPVLSAALDPMLRTFR